MAKLVNATAYGLKYICIYKHLNKIIIKYSENSYNSTDKGGLPSARQLPTRDSVQREISTSMCESVRLTYNA